MSEDYGTHADLITLTAYMADECYPARDVAYAVQKPWKFRDVLAEAKADLEARTQPAPPSPVTLDLGTGDPADVVRALRHAARLEPDTADAAYLSGLAAIIQTKPTYAPVINIKVTDQLVSLDQHRVLGAHWQCRHPLP